MKTRNIGLFRHERGTSSVEFALISMALVVLGFGIVEVGWFSYQWNAAQKATQLGVRLAVVSDPIPNGLETATCTGLAGANCASGDSFGTITCGSSGCTGGSSYSGARTAVFNAIVTRMRAVQPLIQSANVQVVYRDVPHLRWVGRARSTLNPTGGVVPEVTVRLQNLTYRWLILGSMLGLPNLNMGGFTATQIGEDMNSAGQS
jgi:TadE-like protein